MLLARYTLFVFIFFSALLHAQTGDSALHVPSINEVKVDNNDFLSNGNFVETKLAHILSAALNIDNKDFASDTCLQVKNLGKGGGYNTLQLFLVSSKCDVNESHYIIKEPRDGLGEIKNMNMLISVSKLRNLALPNSVAGLPSLALPVGYLSYKKNNNTHYLIIMPMAEGKSLDAYITQYRDGKSSANKETLANAFFELGKEMANFYKLNMKSSAEILGDTITHGDFHFFNIFYDGKRFTLIDTESMAKSLTNPINPSADLIKLFFMAFSINDAYRQFHDLIKGIDLKTWFDISLKNFIIGYKNTYPENEQSKVIQELRKIFTVPFKPIPWVDFDNDQLNEMRQKYIVPIFDELRRQADDTL